ncbi:RlpA-like double-psi beta-barrel-protein domain-containing protein-containing protein [Cristinia sonorae]|uniref:RlpA-like double-psi beta-barrel-protein domain-containing protein-containing protein n=1 Tax=Cristinia sonorae TaxID=1940300 RepID=A0A8K0UIB5_9AGAR|nr:RlpA-like double-psi beta-barrel-protein domain-containing protein-containing protein [Cristinia sonorae]
MLTFAAPIIIFMSLFMLVRAAPVVTGTGDATFYTPGLGACGGINTEKDFIVAVSTQIFNGFPGAGANPNKNPICGKKLTATSRGKKVTVKIVDQCPGCSRDSIDLSPAAFNTLADPATGRLHNVRWTIG